MGGSEACQVVVVVVIIIVINNTMNYHYQHELF